LSLTELKFYLVKHVEHPDVSLLDRSVTAKWETVTALTDFSYPWEKEEAPSTVFKSTHDNKWLYCNFRITDKDIRVFVKTNIKEEVLHGDRVELFFKRDEKMDEYYCLEIDPCGRVYDYRAAHYRKFEPMWAWPSGHLKVETRQGEDGYEVAIAISLESLEDLGLLSNGRLQAGLFRGKCISLSAENQNMKWISWVNPNSETPDFHIPSAFGVLELEKIF
jgi:hypothetical protein